MSSMRSRCWFGNCHKEAKMDHILSVILVSLLTGMTALLSHRSAAVFHDGIRPILPQLVEGHMNRREAGSIAFGLSIGFVASVGISFTLSTGLLNSWLLFLPTDIIGVLAVNVWLAFILGAIWGILVFTSLQPINQLLTSLPVDIIGALGELSNPVVSAFALFPGRHFLPVWLETKRGRRPAGAAVAPDRRALFPASVPGIDRNLRRYGFAVGHRDFPRSERSAGLPNG